jgi:hypothetical protein
MVKILMDNLATNWAVYQYHYPVVTVFIWILCFRRLDIIEKHKYI